MKKTSVLIITAILAIFTMYGTGLIRDSIFTNLNKEYSAGAKQQLKSQPFAKNNTTIQKWILTFVFSALYLALSLAVVHIFFGDKKYLILTCLLFAFVFSFSLSLTVVGLLIGKQELFYRISRDIMGMLQSPFLLMVLIPAFYIAEQNPAHKT